MEIEPEVYDVIVIGGGLCGLSTARKLIQQGKRVLVLEARDRLGGRTCTLQYEGHSYDLGAQWVGPSQHRVLELMRELNLKPVPQFDTGKNIIINTRSRVVYTGLIPTFPSVIPFVPSLYVLYDIHRTIKKLDKLSNTIDIEEPWNSPNAEELDKMTLEAWRNQHCKTRAAKGALDGATSAVFAADPPELSLLYFLFYLKSSGADLEKIAGIQGGAQEQRIEGGTQQLSERLGELVGREHIKLSSPVRSVTYNEEKKISPEIVTLNTIGDQTEEDFTLENVRIESDSGTYTCKQVIMAIPPALCDKINYSPPLPISRSILTQRMPMGSIIKILLFYNTPWWRNEGYSGQIVCTDGKMEHPVVLTYDDCDPSATHSCLLAFISGATAIKWYSHTENQRKRVVLQQMADQFKNPEALNCINYVEKIWAHEEWSKGCYTGYMPPGGSMMESNSNFLPVMTTCGKSLREPVGPIHFAGTETAREWIGYMEGALESAEYVANRILGITKGRVK